MKISKEQIFKIRKAHHAYGLGFSVDQRDNRVYITIRPISSWYLRKPKIDAYTQLNLEDHLRVIFRCKVYSTSFRRWTDNFEGVFRLK